MCGDRSLFITFFLCLATFGFLLGLGEKDFRGLDLITDKKGEYIRGSGGDRPKTSIKIERPPVGGIVMANTRHKLYCKARDPDSKLTIKWFHNGEKMYNKGPNFAINKFGTLRFFKVQVRDRGRYHCTVRNEFGDLIQSRIATLTVHAISEIIDKPLLKQERRQTIGSYTWITCKAVGIPLPRIEWRKNGILLKNGSGENPKTMIWLRPGNKASINSTLKDQANQSSVYTCSAINVPIIGQKNSSATINVTVVPVAPLAEARTDPNLMRRPNAQCARYTGTVCRRYLAGQWVTFSPTDGSVSQDQDKALVALWREMDDLELFKANTDQVKDSFCRRPAERLMCHMAFPSCDNPTTRPLPICRESCIAVKNLFCLSQWAELDEMKKDGKLLKNRGDLRLPVCSDLPSKWNSSTPCIDSDHHEYNPAFVSDQCYVKSGRWYNGTVNTTKSGRPCQQWEETYPQAHERSPAIYPELTGAENFCRNPGAEEDSPWCYTLDKLVRWEKCNVQPCDIPKSTPPFATSNDQPLGIQEDKEETMQGDVPEELDLLLIIIIAICCVLVFVCVFAVSFIVFRKCSHSRYNATPQDDVDIDVHNLPHNSAYHQIKSNRLDPRLEILEFPRNDIEYIMDIGQGAFGRVFQARLVCSNGNSHITGGKLSLSGSKHSLSCGKHCKHSHHHNHLSSKSDIRQQHLELISSTPKEDHWLPEHIHPSSLSGEPHKPGPEGGENQQLIAVKMLKEDASETIQTDFEREASLMVKFDHPNIIRLLGVCTLGKPMCLLFEYMSKGDLNDFLRNCSPDQCLIRNRADPLPPITDVSSVDIVDQLHMARQVAAGMVYISDRGFVHRDLATRNCLVGSGLVVKIADFGLARSIHSMNYYHGSDKDAIPIRWMPPEAILYNKFSSQSDVWSFGVLLWEIFTFALQPYYGMTHEEVINYLCNGNVLECPTNVPSSVHELMKSCWKKKPSARPNFNSLQKSLDSTWEDRSKKKARQTVPV